jgi:hypothetical protein
LKREWRTQPTRRFLRSSTWNLFTRMKIIPNVKELVEEEENVEKLGLKKK